MNDLTVISTELAKICLFDHGKPEANQPFEELYLSERDVNVEDGEENDHLTIQKMGSKDGGVIYHINGKEVEPRVIEEIVRFLID